MVFVFDLDDTICDTDKYSEKGSYYFATVSVNKQAFLATTNYNKNLVVPNGVVRFKDFNDLTKKIMTSNHFMNNI